MPTGPTQKVKAEMHEAGTQVDAGDHVEVEGQHGCGHAGHHRVDGVQREVGNRALLVGEGEDHVRVDAALGIAGQVAHLHGVVEADVDQTLDLVAVEEAHGTLLFLLLVEELLVDVALLLDLLEIRVVVEEDLEAPFLANA